MAKRGRPFEVGNTFGRGRPRGSRNKATADARELLDQYSMPVLRGAIAGALKGDPTMIRLVLDRALPARREAPVNLATLPMKTLTDLAKLSQEVVGSVISGKITISEGQDLLNLFDAHRKGVHTAELEERVRSLESQT